MSKRGGTHTQTDHGENGGVAGFNLAPLMPTKRDSHPLSSHEQMAKINAESMTGFRWDIRFDGV